MYETVALLKKECVEDLEVLERALEAAKGTEAEREDIVLEQQVWEALERLKGRMCQYEAVGKEGLLGVGERETAEKEKLLRAGEYEAVKKEEVLREGEYEALRDMLIRGEEEFLRMMEGILCRAEVNRTMKLFDIQRGFLEIYRRLYGDVMEEYSYFGMYFDEFEFSGLEGREIRTMERLYEGVLEIGRKMLELIGCFRLDTRSELIGQVADYAWRNVEKKISLEKIAEEFFVNKTYLSHLFKQETGRTFVNFFTEIRMLRSRVLLRQHYRVYECALQLGYEDAEYFSRVFKNYFGCKPTEYMAQLDNQAFRHNNRAACQQ